MTEVGQKVKKQPKAKPSVRNKAAHAADDALVKAWNERGGRFGEDGPVAIVMACRAYDRVIMAALRRYARRQSGLYMAQFMDDAIKSLGNGPSAEKGL
jgi:hypothetical protein